MPLGDADKILAKSLASIVVNKFEDVEKYGQQIDEDLPLLSPYHAETWKRCLFCHGHRLLPPEATTAYCGFHAYIIGSEGQRPARDQTAAIAFLEHYYVGGPLIATGENLWSMGDIVQFIDLIGWHISDELSARWLRSDDPAASVWDIYWSPREEEAREGQEEAPEDQGEARESQEEPQESQEEAQEGQEEPQENQRESQEDQSGNGSNEDGNPTPNPRPRRRRRRRGRKHKKAKQGQEEPQEEQEEPQENQAEPLEGHEEPPQEGQEEPQEGQSGDGANEDGDPSPDPSPRRRRRRGGRKHRGRGGRGGDNGDGEPEA